MSAIPGPRIPAESHLIQTTLDATGVDTASTGTTSLGTILADEAEVEVVRVDGSVADFDYNVNLNSTAIFGSDQSPAAASAEEAFPAGTDYRDAGIDSAEVVFEVTSAGSAGTVDVEVLVSHHREV